MAIGVPITPLSPLNAVKASEVAYPLGLTPGGDQVAIAVVGEQVHRSDSPLAAGAPPDVQQAAAPHADPEPGQGDHDIVEPLVEPAGLEVAGCGGGPELTREIKDEARRQLATHGAGQLSLRAVARQLGLVSSALYRYFRSRDDLLTALIVDAYDALGAAAELADAAHSASDLRGRWRAACHALRDWALQHPHEYALVYGSPVPGYQAPQDTIAPASRGVLVLLRVIRDGRSAGVLAPAFEGPAAPPALLAQAERLAGVIAPELPAPVLIRALIAWTQLFGMISFELFGHLVGSVDPSDAFFDHVTEQMADFVGLPRVGLPCATGTVEVPGRNVL